MKETKERELENICEDLLNVKKSMVGWKNFIWVIGIVTMAIGYIANNQQNISSEQTIAKVELAKIQTKLVSIELSLEEIKTTLKDKK